jgi:hypothetical protein
MNQGDAKEISRIDVLNFIYYTIIDKEPVLARENVN